MDYSRQIMLPQVGLKGQRVLAEATAAVIGAGAIGGLAAELLCRSGVGKLLVIERDIVEESNLHRQTLYYARDIGQSKAHVAKARLSEANPDVQVEAAAIDLNNTNAHLIKADIVLDCTDNMETRYLINDYCMKERIRWVYSAAIKETGTVFPISPGGPCLACAIPEAEGLETCDTSGVLPAITSATASMQAAEAIKLLLGITSNEMVRYDIWNNDFARLKVRSNPNCPACNGSYDYLSGAKGSRTTKLCGSGTYQLSGGKISMRQLKQVPGARILEYGVILPNATVFSDGRAVIKAGSEQQARVIYARITG